MGVFAALIFPATLSVISNAFPDRRQRAAALGGWGAVVGVGVATGPVVGGLLLTTFSWGSVFLALAPLALVAAGLAAFLVPESRDPAAPPLDRRGLVLSTAMLGLLVWTVIEAPSRGWGSPATIIGFAGSAVLLVAFVIAERRAAHPMLDITLFADRRFSAASGAVTVTFFSLAGFIFLVTQYFQVVRGYDALSTGARILPVAVSIAVASMAGGLLAPRLGTRAVVTTGLLMFGSAMAWIAASPVDVPYATSIVPQMVLLGLGMGLISTPATESILRVLPPARAGVGSAVNDATRELGATLGVAVVGSVFASVYGAALSGGAFDRLPEAAQDQARESVVAAAAIAQGQPELMAAAPGRVHGRDARRQRARRRPLPGRRCRRGDRPTRTPLHPRQCPERRAARRGRTRARLTCRRRPATKEPDGDRSVDARRGARGVRPRRGDAVGRSGGSRPAR